MKEDGLGSPEREVLPDLYDPWISALLGGDLPREDRAPCRACVMTGDPSVGSPAPLVKFDPATKCCTYMPVLPNFLVGRILVDATSDAHLGKESVVGRIASGAGVSPLGLSKSPLFNLIYDRARPQLFGRTPALRCPHYVDEHGGLCGIWSHRNGVCSTWFCRHHRGEVGQQFWTHLSAFLTALESDLAVWCLNSLGFFRPPVARLLLDHASHNAGVSIASQFVDAVHNKHYAEVWGGWAGKEQALYVECGLLVERLTLEDVLARVGPETLAWVPIVRESFRSLLDTDLPRRLTYSPSSTSRLTPTGEVELTTYSPYDPVSVRADVWKHLYRFDGSLFSDVLQGIPPTDQALFTEQQLRGLVDYGVLRTESAASNADDAEGSA